MTKKTAATIDLYRGDLAKLEETIAALDAQIDPLVRARREASIMAEKLRESIDKMRLESAGDDFELLLDASASRTVYERALKVFSEMGLLVSCEWRDTGQRCLNVMLTRGSQESLEKTLAAIRELSGHYKPQPDGFVHYSVFENTLSESGSYYLLVSPDFASAMVTQHSYSRVTTLFEGDLKSAVAFVQENHWYDDPEEEGDE